MCMYNGTKGSRLLIIGARGLVAGPSPTESGPPGAAKGLQAAT